MIKIKDCVPSVYYDSSRDFQLIGHLFDLVINATKTDVDLLFNLPFSVNSDDQLLDLLTYTFGLRLKTSKYTSAQLRAVCSVAPEIMRNKGSIKAVRTLCAALMHAEGIEGSFSLAKNPARPYSLDIKISKKATCQDLLLDLLPYIMPAGLDFNIKYLDEASVSPKTTFELSDRVRYTTNVVKSNRLITRHSKLPYVKHFENLMEPMETLELVEGRLQTTEISNSKPQITEVEVNDE